MEYPLTIVETFSREDILKEFRALKSRNQVLENGINRILDIITHTPAEQILDKPSDLMFQISATCFDVLYSKSI